jgi:hypothetical protein
MKIIITLPLILLAAGCSPAQQLPNGYEPEMEPSTPVATVPAGQPFDYHVSNMQDSEERPMDWRVTLTKTECGIKTIEKALPNPKWDGGDEHPEYISAKADAGKDFCIVYWDWENVGKEPGQPDAAGDIVVNGERYPRAGEDEELSEHVMENKLGHEWGDVSPHDKTKSLDVYLVPEGSKPEAVWFPYENLVDPTSDHLIATY